MEKLTKEKRHEIYKQALELNIERIIRNQDYNLGFCNLAAKVLFGTDGEYDKIKPEMFPEYWLFKPKTKENCWFSEPSFLSTSISGNEIRQVAIQFCIEMTK